MYKVILFRIGVLINKVTHFTRIKFLKSKRNSLMMKDKLYKCNKVEKSTVVLNTGSVVHMKNALDH